MWEIEDYEAKIQELDEQLSHSLSENQRSHLTTQRALFMDRIVVLRERHKKQSAEGLALLNEEMMQ